jgi:hypothetical protein
LEKRNMANSPFIATIIDERTPPSGSAASVRHVTPNEIQRWEDDGGAVLPDALPRKQRSLRCITSGVTDSGIVEFHPRRAERYLREAVDEMIAAD